MIFDPKKPSQFTFVMNLKKSEMMPLKKDNEESLFLHIFPEAVAAEFLMDPTYYDSLYRKNYSTLVRFKSQ